MRPLLEGRPTEWREFVASEHHIDGRMVRTPQFKFVHYANDPVEQLFDMKADPWEMTNLYDDPAHADVVRDHRRLLVDWEASLEPVEPMPAKPKRPRRS